MPLILIFLPIEVGATPDHIGIMLSSTCLAMHKANISSNCPTYEEILQVFPDTTDPEISGGFVYNEYGLLERDKPKVKNQMAFYKYSDKKIIQWIDPPPEISLKGNKRIIIAPDNFTYKEKNQILTNSSLLVNEDRYVSSTCTYSIISADRWLTLLGDTLQFMLHDCDLSYTNYNELKRYSWKAVEHDITTSHKYKLEKWIQQAKEKCKLIKCNYDNSLNPPYSNQIEQGELLGIKYKFFGREKLNFEEESINNHTHKEITPCEKDRKSLLCEVWKYKNEESKPNQSKR